MRLAVMTETTAMALGRLSEPRRGSALGLSVPMTTTALVLDSQEFRTVTVDAEAWSRLYSRSICKVLTARGTTVTVIKLTRTVTRETAYQCYHLVLVTTSLV